MGVMTIALVAALICAVTLLPSHVSFSDAISLARAAGKLNIVTTKFDWNDRYNLWSGLLRRNVPRPRLLRHRSVSGAALSDRPSIAASRQGLFFNAAAKIPMQAFILFIGAMVFVFYILPEAADFV